MESTERQIEAAVAAVSRQTDAAIAGIRARLSEDGADACTDCGGEIGAARRAAMPSAKRCIGCQALFEGVSRGHR